MMAVNERPAGVRYEPAMDDGERLRLIEASVLDCAVFELDGGGCIATWSVGGEKTFGYSTGEALRLGFADLFAPEERDERKPESQLLESAILGRSTTEGWLLRRDTGRIWCERSVKPVRDAAGRLRGYFVVVRDFTDRKRLETQLGRAQKIEGIGQLAGGIAHDFNNLMSAIMGFTDLAKSEAVPDTDLMSYLNAIEHAAERAAGLTRQLLAFSRRAAQPPRVVSLNPILSGIEPILRRLISEDIELITVGDPALGSVRIDPSQFEQVIVNLALNARDAMPDGGKLLIETANVRLDDGVHGVRYSAPPGDYVMLAVTDTGCGMPDEVQEHLFEPFYTTKDVAKGTGLGLSTCAAIVRQAGGHIWLYSEVGHGSTFKIYLPRVLDPGSPPDEIPTEESARGGSERILLVEDEELVRTMAARALRRMGYEVSEGSNGAEGLEIADSMPIAPDLLVTDVIMPRMGGKQLADQLTARWPGLRVLFVSGYTDESIARKGMMSDGVWFLQKPFTPSLLALKVREALDSARSAS